MEEMVTNGSANLTTAVEPQPPGTTIIDAENHSDMTTEFSHFEAFNPETCQWRTYAERLQNHFELYDIPDAKRVRVLIDRVGNATYDQLRRLCAPDPPLSKTADELFELLSGHFYPPTNKYKERVKFHRRVMRPEQTLQEYAEELRKAAQACEFPAHWLQEALRTQFTHGIRSNELRVMLYEMEPIDFDKMVEFASSVKLPPPAPKKVSSPKAAKVAKLDPPAAPAKPAAPKPAAPKAAAPPAKKPQQAKQAKKNPPPKKGFKTPFRQQPFRKNPSWQDYDDGYNASYNGPSYGGQYQNNYSNSNQRFVESTYQPNDSLFYRR